MPTKRLDEYREMTYTIDGNEYYGIPDFECNFEPAVDYIRENISLDQTGSMTFTARCRLNKWLIYKLIGVYDWVLNNCPNKRVVHLAKYARKQKTRSKNFNRAIRLIAKLYAN